MAQGHKMHIYTKHDYLSLSSFRLELGKSLETGHKLIPRQPLHPCSAPQKGKTAKAWVCMERTAVWNKSPNSVPAFQATSILLSSHNKAEEPRLKAPSQGVSCCISPTPCIRGLGEKHQRKVWSSLAKEQICIQQGFPESILCFCLATGWSSTLPELTALTTSLYNLSK